MKNMFTYFIKIEQVLKNKPKQGQSFLEHLIQELLRTDKIKSK